MFVVATYLSGGKRRRHRSTVWASRTKGRRGNEGTAPHRTAVRRSSTMAGEDGETQGLLRRAEQAGEQRMQRDRQLLRRGVLAVLLGLTVAAWSVVTTSQMSHDDALAVGTVAVADEPVPQMQAQAKSFDEAVAVNDPFQPTDVRQHDFGGHTLRSQSLSSVKAADSGSQQHPMRMAPPLRPQQQEQPQNSHLTQQHQSPQQRHMPEQQQQQQQQQQQGVENPPKHQHNLLFIVLDDLPWTDLREESDFKHVAPNLMDLASESIRLRKYYGMPVCTPARAALMTGRHPVVTGMHYGVLGQSDEYGLPLDYTLFPEQFSDAGYNTMIVGKWHLGHYTTDYLPTARGFDSFIGYLGGEETYTSHAFPHVIQVDDVSYSHVHDFFESNSNGSYHTLKKREGEYSLDVFTTVGKQFLEEQDHNTPWFLELSLQNVHGPLHVPSKTYLTKKRIKSLRNKFGDSRKLLSAMSLAAADNAIQEILDTLKQQNMYESTTIVVSGDNGGCMYSGGFNSPLRGAKASVWEGGSRIDAFIRSPGKLQSGHYTSLFQIQDWYPTLMSLLDVNSSLAISDFVPQLDGMDHTEALKSVSAKTGENSIEGPRTSMVYNVNSRTGAPTWEDTLQFAVRVGDYKYIQEVYQGYYKNSSSAIDSGVSTAEDCSAPVPSPQGANMLRYVYDLSTDPYEAEGVSLDSLADDDDGDSSDDTEDQSIKAQLEEYINWVLPQVVDSASVQASSTDSTKWQAMIDDGNYLKPWN